MSDDKVINAFGRRDELPENPMQVRPDRHSCLHPAILADVHTRTVECTKCGANLDPFNFVATNAAMIQRAWDHHRQVYELVKKLNESVDALKREERKLRDRVKRLQDKSGAITLRGGI